MKSHFESKSTAGLSLCLLTLALLSACAFSVSVRRTPGAPSLPGSAYAEMLRVPPKNATEIAVIEAQGNTWQTGADCDKKMVIEARKLGANAVFIQPEEEGLGQGARCSARAYLLGK